MLTYAQALILGALQGITELFPISSLGHTVILPALLGWKVDQTDPFFVSFLVATHLATALVLLGFFLGDWVRIVKGIFRSLSGGSTPDDVYSKVGWLLIIGTIPAGLVGLIFQKKLEALFALPVFAAVFLIGNGIMLLAVEFFSAGRVRTWKHDDGEVARLSWLGALGIGLAQCLALLPGFSRTGATLSGGLLAKLSHADAARFSFLLATPIILAAAVLKLPSLAFGGSLDAIGIACAGAVAAALFAYLSVRFLTQYFKTNTLTPFGIYCVLAGALALVVLA